MIYIASICSASIITALLFLFMLKNGYFVWQHTEHIPLISEDIVIPDSDNDAQEEKQEIENDISKQNSSSEHYSKNQSIVITTVFFALALILHYLLFTYTVTANVNQQPLLFIKMVIMNGVVGTAALTDYKRHKIPNPLISFGFILRAVIYIFEFIFFRDNFLFILKNDGLGFFLGFVVLFMIALISRGGLGYGDVKLFGVIGLMTGSAGVFFTLFLSLVINSIVALGMVAAKKKTFNSSLPMAPFIYAGYVSVCILGLF